MNKKHKTKQWTFLYLDSAPDHIREVNIPLDFQDVIKNIELFEINRSNRSVFCSARAVHLRVIAKLTSSYQKSALKFESTNKKFEILKRRQL